MDPKEQALDVLTQALNDPAQADRHERIRAVLRKAGRIKEEAPVAAPMQPAAAPESPKMTVNLGLGPREYADDNSFVSRTVRGLSRMGDALHTPAMLVNKGLDTAFFGAPRQASDALSKLTGTRIGPGPEEYQKLAEQHPHMTALADLGGDVTPIGLPAKIGSEAMHAADPLVSILAKRASSAPGRVAAKTLGSSLAGGGAAAFTAAARKLIEGGSSRDAALAGANALPGGMGFGAAFGGLTGVAGEAAAGMRAHSPDIQALDRAGLEPSPIPGRPIIRKDLPLSSQLPAVTEPPLGTARQTPETRGSSARVAADEIVPDITARKKANNQRFGQLQAELYSTEGQNPAPFKHIIGDIDQRLADQSLPDATRKALGDVRGKFEPFLPKPPSPQLVALQEMLAKASPASRAGIERAVAEAQAQEPPPKPFTAKDLDQIRDYADSKVRAGEIGKGDVPFLQVSENMRNTLARADVAPGIADLNTKQSDVMKGFSKRKALLGMKRDQRGEGEDVYEAVARRVRERGEETATSGVRRGAEGHAVERAGRLGQPPVLPGTTGLPEEISYQAKLDVPRLQLAQENMQVRPSKVFSGGGQSPIGVPYRMLQLIEPRVGYPLARRLGEAELGGKTIGAADLIHMFNRRRDEEPDTRSGNEPRG